jgi:hypothetical protein
LCYDAAEAQFNRPVGAASSGMGNASVVKSDIWSGFHNQAGLANLKGPSAGLFFSNQFHLSELSTKAFAIASPVGKNAGIGVNFTQFGFELYNENKFGLAYAMKLTPKLSTGIQLDWFSTRFGNGYGQARTAVGEIGILSQPVENLYIGAHVFNPWLAKVSKYDTEKVPTVFRIGLGYNFSDKALFSVETEKDIDKPAVFKCGVEYTPLKNAFIRLGVSSTPILLSFGAGYNFKNIQVDFAYVNHQVLGYTTQFGLSYTFVR